jgi:hypothetical protein
MRRGFVGSNFTINAKTEGSNFETLGFLPEPKASFAGSCTALNLMVVSTSS